VMDAVSFHPQVLEELEKVLSTDSQPMVLENREIDITCSIGVSLFPHDAKDTTVLLRNADAAVRRAKDLGRNNVQFFTAELNARMSDRLSLQTMMRRPWNGKNLNCITNPRSIWRPDGYQASRRCSDGTARTGEWFRRLNLSLRLKLQG
ncbi:MAG TPA: diguanylate cyclase, partial [Sulfuricaulis sp.]|nr:diguanylate cyclase [Sulfuricaulis sp.]